MAKRNPRKLDVNRDYVLKTRPPEDPDLMAFYNPVYVVANRPEIVTGPDFAKAVKFTGRWLNDTCWFFEIFYKAVQYEEEYGEWQKRQKTIKHHHEGKRRKGARDSEGKPDRNAGVRPKALDGKSGNRIRPKSKPKSTDKKRMEGKASRVSPGRKRRA